MSPTRILFSPLPIIRLGILLDTDIPFNERPILFVPDFFVLGSLLNEYISFGAISIVIPRSYQPAQFMSEVPERLRDRIQIIDDSKEIETIARVLFGIRAEFKADFDHESGNLTFPDNISTEIRRLVGQAHYVLRCLALGFNHGLEIELNIALALADLFALKKLVVDGTSRGALSQIEALLRQYTEVRFNTQSPKESAQSN
jgi:hypothetical protein